MKMSSWNELLVKFWARLNKPLPTAKSRIVEAVGTASGGKKNDLAKRIEEAMPQAILDAVAAGVSLSDRDGIAAFRMRARARVMAESTQEKKS